jgi:glycosyltransferase involved in cell wall biosynthesis
MNDLLAICLQTFNSAPCLKDYLDNIVPQARARSIPIHVYVTSSTDNTLQVLKDFQKEYPLLFFKYSDTNYGHDKSLISATRMAAAKYIWPIGVRRRLSPFAVEKVYKALQKSKPNLLIINTVERKSSTDTLATEYYDDLQEVFLKFYLHLGLLGSLVLPAEAWKLPALNKYLEDERLSAWIHLPTTFEYLASLPNFMAVYLSSPLITSTGTFPSTWNRKFFDTHEKWTNIVRTLPKIGVENKRFIIEKEYRAVYQPKNLLLLRSYGVYDEAVFKRYNQVFYQFTNPTASRVMSELPVLPLNMGYKAYTAVRKIMRMFIHSYYPINPLNDRPPIQVGK